MVLISGPTNLIIPLKVKCINVQTAEEMQHSVMQEISVSGCDAFIAAAAVADYRPKIFHRKKSNWHAK